MPLFGEVTKTKIIDLHLLKMFATRQFEEEEEGERVGIHYDLYPTSQESINILMFEILILGCINNGSHGMLHFQEDIHFYIEIAQNLNDIKDRFFFFAIVKNIKEMRWNNNDILIGNTPLDKNQQVCKYLLALKQNKFNLKELYQESRVMSSQECQQLYQEFFLKDVLNKNFYCLNSFIQFAYY